MASARRDLAWIPPLRVATGLSNQDGLLCLLSDGGAHGRFSFVALAPDLVCVDAVADDPFDLLALPEWDRHVVGLVSYDAGARRVTGSRASVWPDRIVARYPALLVFDHHQHRVAAHGIGADAKTSQAMVERAAGWLDTASQPLPRAAPGHTFTPQTSDQAYRHAVADVVGRIEAGELFQANIARAWSGRLQDGRDPFDVFVRLAEGAAPFGAFWRLGERALVSNSPEMFVTFDRVSGDIETRPIKGTRPRDPDPDKDAANIDALMASEKDRAENLMIVDLMRNDLAQVAKAGSVTVPRLFELESFATVHHLVSTVTARAAPGVGPGDLLAAAFPPGSITGAPKHQAMKVIAGHEPPRGPWCGSLFMLDPSSRLTASVLIRTIGCERRDGIWTFRTLAGAGIVADSDPDAELAETEAKIAAIRSALMG